MHPHLVLSQQSDTAVGGEEELDGLSSQLGGLNLGGGSDTASVEEQGSLFPTQSFMGVFQTSFVSTRVSRGGY